jgi:hypothetical protein
MGFVNLCRNINIKLMKKGCLWGLSVSRSCLLNIMEAKSRWLFLMRYIQTIEDFRISLFHFLMKLQNDLQITLMLLVMILLMNLLYQILLKIIAYFFLKILINSNYNHFMTKWDKFYTKMILKLFSILKFHNFLTSLESKMES